MQLQFVTPRVSLAKARRLTPRIAARCGGWGVPLQAVVIEVRGASLLTMNCIRYGSSSVLTFAAPMAFATYFIFDTVTCASERKNATRVRFHTPAAGAHKPLRSRWWPRERPQNVLRA